MPIVNTLRGYFETINNKIGTFLHKHGDAGYDLYTTEDRWVFPFRVVKIPLNCKVEIPEDHFGLITSRSGMSVLGLFTIPGIIDSIYRGQCNAIMFRVGLFPKKIKAGTRVCQIIIVPYREMHWKKKNIVPDTERGVNSFGKSGTM